MPLAPSNVANDPELMHWLHKESKPVQCCCRTHALFHQGDEPAGLYLLHRGAVTLSAFSAAGKFTLLVQTTAGTLLGLPSLFCNDTYPLTAIVHGGSELSFMSRDLFFALLESSPHWSRKILQVLAAEVNSTRHAILNQICVGAEISDSGPAGAQEQRREAKNALPYVGWLPTEWAG